VVVTVPGLGDDIQAIKAGILEVADILVINKADREGASRTYQELLHMLDLRGQLAWKPPVLMTQAKDDVGTEELMAALSEHRKFLAQDGGAARHAALAFRTRQEFLELLKEGIFRHLVKQLEADGRLNQALSEMLAKETDPYSASEALILEKLGPIKRPD
jgi:LAO/AO transport system kinase